MKIDKDPIWEHELRFCEDGYTVGMSAEGGYPIGDYANRELWNCVLGCDNPPKTKDEDFDDEDEFAYPFGYVLRLHKILEN